VHTTYMLSHGAPLKTASACMQAGFAFQVVRVRITFYWSIPALDAPWALNNFTCVMHFQVTIFDCMATAQRARPAFTGQRCR